ncbi:MAG: hypothetical protein DMD29_06230, partial [Gemmatimonadetes bacterium]
RRKQAVLSRALTAAGVPAQSLARIRVPVGLPIGAETPEEIAVSVVAELVAWRRGVTSPAPAASTANPSPTVPRSRP